MNLEITVGRMAWAAGAVLLLAATSAPAAPAEARDAEPVSVQLGQAFVLQPGQSVVLASAAGGLLLGFDRVLADSRCPKGERCIWAGDAVAQVWLAPPGEPRTAGELHTAAGRINQLTAGGHSLQLLALEPAPISGRAQRPGSYRATLVLQAASAPAGAQRQ